MGKLALPEPDSSESRALAVSTGTETSSLIQKSESNSDFNLAVSDLASHRVEDSSVLPSTPRRRLFFILLVISLTEAIDILLESELLLDLAAEAIASAETGLAEGQAGMSTEEYLWASRDESEFWDNLSDCLRPGRTINEV